MVNSPYTSSAEKEPWIAVNLSKLVPGLGQIYADRFQRGFIIFLISFVNTCITLASLCYSRVSLVIGLILILFNFGLWIWNLFDAHQCLFQNTTEAFKESRKQCKNPWIAIFWSSFIPGIGHFYLKKPWIGVLLVILTAFLFWIPIVGILWTCLVIYLSYIGASDDRPRIPNKFIQFIAIFFVVTLLNVLTPFLVRTYVAEARYMPSGSMEPTLQINDRLVINKVAYYFDAPKRGNIIVFNPTQILKEQGFHDAFIKRVIGVPGDLIALKDGRVYINNQRLSEPYTNASPTLIEPCGGVATVEGQTLPPPFLSVPVTIPQNNFLVLGDNRSNSYDGRCWGLVAQSEILGKATKLYWPLSRLGPVPEVTYPELPY
jgi:signal peptidase I